MVMNWWVDPDFNVIEMNWDSVLALVWNYSLLNSGIVDGQSVSLGFVTELLF